MSEALSVNFLGTTVYLYGLSVMLGCLLFMLVLCFRTRKNEKQALAAGHTGLFSLILGFILARLMYVLLQPDYAPFLNLKNALDVFSGGFAMYGALIGAVLAALLGAKLAGVNKAEMLDHLAVAIPAFLVPARLGEGFTALGISRPLTTQWLSQSFLAIKDEYDAYLRTYLLEAAVALLLFVLLWRFAKKVQKPGLVFIKFCLLYGITQTLMESLRYDGHLRYSFVGVQQVLSAALFSLTLVFMAVKLLKNPKTNKTLPLISLIMVPVILLAIVGVEFLIDRSEMGKLFSYALYLLALAVPAVLGMLMLNMEVRLGQGID
ncbi:MAG: prolipoprotein diacylglyceryl transferase [Bacillota bacterium]|nr:prolipoprotein diacylglyceryl transferase [Bacillota bacterium]